MHRPTIPHRTVLTLLAATVLLPITICVVLGVAALLAAMGDSLGGAVLQRVALAGGLLWVVDLICLVLVLAINAVKNRDEPEEP